MEKFRIGENALNIWQLLNVMRVVSFAEISQRLCLSMEEITLAIGWLARENKVCIEKKQDALYLTDGSEFDFSFG